MVLVCGWARVPLFQGFILILEVYVHIYICANKGNKSAERTPLQKHGLERKFEGNRRIKNTEIPKGGRSWEANVKIENTEISEKA